jgi:transposase
MLLADRGHNADWIRELAANKGAWANIPPKSNRNKPICFSPYLYRARNLVERFFNSIKRCRRVATRYDKLATNYLASSLRRYGDGFALMSPRPSSNSRPSNLFFGAAEPTVQ